MSMSNKNSYFGVHYILLLQYANQQSQ